MKDKSYFLRRSWNPLIIGSDIAMYRADKRGAMSYDIICEAHGVIGHSSTMMGGRHLMKAPAQFCERCAVLASGGRKRMRCWVDRVTPKDKTFCLEHGKPESECLRDRIRFVEGAFQKYGNHLRSCDFLVDPASPKNCTCGFLEILKQTMSITI